MVGVGVRSIGSVVARLLPHPENERKQRLVKRPIKKQEATRRYGISVSPKKTKVNDHVF
jgi:hypothetical protein